MTAGEIVTPGAGSDCGSASIARARAVQGEGFGGAVEPVSGRRPATIWLVGGWSPTGWTHRAYQARGRISQWDVCALPAEHRATAAGGHGKLPGEHVFQCLQIARVDRLLNQAPGRQLVLFSRLATVHSARAVLVRATPTSAGNWRPPLVPGTGL